MRTSSNAAGLLRAIARLAVMVVGITGLSAFALGQVSSLPDVPQAASEQPTGSGRISGQVVAADNGAPVKRAQVMLSGMARVAGGSAAAGGSASGGATTTSTTTTTFVARDNVVTQTTSSGMPPGMVRKQAETDDAGRFDFTDLPQGQFSIMLMSPPTGFARADRAESVRITGDAPTATVTIKLARTGAITGRILDESGEPLARVMVQAMRRDSTTGGRLAPVGSGSFATTDDLGQFRLYGLPAGDYYVMGTYNGQQAVIMSDVRQPATPRIGYGPTYYPGSATLEGGRRVAVQSGQDTPGIEFSMQRVQLGRITGTAVDSTGRSMTGRTDGARFSVSATSHANPNSGRGAMVRPDGSFEIRDLPPGEYDIVASLMRGDGPGAQREAAFTTVSINGNDVAVSLQTNTGATLSGHVIVEGSDPAPSVLPDGRPMPPMPASPIRIAIRPDPARPFLIGNSNTTVQAAEDGTFVLNGARGSVFLTAMGGRGIVKAVYRGGQDVTAKPMMLSGTERITDITIVMTTQTGVLRGKVTNSQGEPVTNATVLVFPDDAERWFQGSPFITVARTISITPTMVSSMTPTPAEVPQGRFSIGPGVFMTPRLLPGRYLVAVLPEGAMLGTDSESLEKLRSTATAVTVDASPEPTTMDLRLPK